MSNVCETVGDKYRVLDAKTGEEKTGIYFCLRLDAKNSTEWNAVQAAMQAYILHHRMAGNLSYADRVAVFNTRGACHHEPDAD